MADTPDVSMQEVDETPIPEERAEAARSTDDATPSVGGVKPLPAGIVPPNKASTAPSQEIIDRFAPGSAPHWVGSAAFLAKDAGADKAGGSASAPATYVKG